MTDEEINNIAIQYHNRDDDDYTLPWGKQKSNYRGSIRRIVRGVIGALEQSGYKIVKKRDEANP